MSETTQTYHSARANEYNFSERDPTAYRETPEYLSTKQRYEQQHKHDLSTKMMPLSSVNKGWVKKVPCMGFNKKASYNRRSDDYAKKPKLNKKTFAEKKSYNRAYDTAKPSVKQRFNVATEERKSVPTTYKSKPAT